ncbi:MAG: V-type ATPase subunit [Oscillospiraceae bacterium]|nr:V-type ATPase subunit [Oscillospiraceae bacterium]
MAARFDKGKVDRQDYLFSSGMIWALKPQQLNKDRIERMLEASNFEDTAKVLEECGYPDMSAMGSKEIELVLSKHRDELYQELLNILPDSQILNLFRMKYDYHNAKVILKAQAQGTDGQRLYSKCGRMAPEALSRAYHEEDMFSIPPFLGEAMMQAKESLATTGDPQSADIILDRAYFKELSEQAFKSGSDFLIKYAKISIDAANLRSAVRAVRMHKDSVFLNRILCEGGDVSVRQLVATVSSKAPLAVHYAGSYLYDAAVLAETACARGALLSLSAAATTQ